eukprot:3941063-Rhodomonas_salina.3
MGSAGVGVGVCPESGCCPYDSASLRRVIGRLGSSWRSLSKGFEEGVGRDGSVGDSWSGVCFRHDRDGDRRLCWWGAVLPLISLHLVCSSKLVSSCKLSVLLAHSCDLCRCDLPVEKDRGVSHWQWEEFAVEDGVVHPHGFLLPEAPYPHRLCGHVPPEECTLQPTVRVSGVWYIW